MKCTQDNQAPPINPFIIPYCYDGLLHHLTTEIQCPARSRPMPTHAWEPHLLSTSLLFYISMMVSYTQMFTYIVSGGKLHLIGSFSCSFNFMHGYHPRRGTQCIFFSFPSLFLWCIFYGNELYLELYARTEGSLSNRAINIGVIFGPGRV
jgi:hypothetical protein